MITIMLPEKLENKLSKIYLSASLIFFIGFIGTFFGLAMSLIGIFIMLIALTPTAVFSALLPWGKINHIFSVKDRIDRGEKPHDIYPNVAFWEPGETRIKYYDADYWFGNFGDPGEWLRERSDIVEEFDSKGNILVRQNKRIHFSQVILGEDNNSTNINTQAYINELKEKREFLSVKQKVLEDMDNEL